MDYANVKSMGVDAIPANLTEEIRKALSQFRDVCSQVQELRDAICGVGLASGGGSGPLPPINSWADDMRSNATHAYEAGDLAFKNIHEIRHVIGV